MYRIQIIGFTILLSFSTLNAETYIIEDEAQKSTYVDGKRQGMTWWYNENKKIKSQVNFENDQENGLYTSYYENGKTKLTVNYVMGQKDGIQKIYYNNGQLGSQVNYNMGRREGVMTEWDSEGFKSSEVFYKHNYKVGLEKFYDHTGKVIYTNEYKMDRNPLMVKLLKDKRKDTLVDLAKYGLMPKEAPEEKRLR
jgi:antitoxin component YwqK of YwqJK toxin-antitoxin module